MIEGFLARRGVSLALKLAPWLVVALLGVALQVTRSTLARVRADNRAVLAEQQRDAAKREAMNADRGARAIAELAARTAAVQPLIVRSTNEVTRYAETPAGRVLCRDPERVRSIDALDGALRSAGATGGGDAAVRPDSAAPAAGR